MIITISFLIVMNTITFAMGYKQVSRMAAIEYCKQSKDCIYARTGGANEHLRK